MQTSVVRPAVAGAVGAAVALAVTELLAATTPLVPSAVDAVGERVIPLVPEPVTRWAIAAFGTRDVVVLNVGTTVLALLVGAGVGVLARRSAAAATGAFVAFGLVGVAAGSAREETAFPLVLVVVAAGVAAGIATTFALLRRAGADHARDPSGAGVAAAAVLERRRFVLAAGGLAAAAVVAAGVGRFRVRDRLAVVDPDAVALPAPARALPDPPAAAHLDVAGITPLFTPNDRFYVIDTAVAVPQVDPDTWRLRVHGLVDRELELTYDDLLALPLEEVDVTLACVSNPVGGDLVGTARWLGTRLDGLLERAGVRADAEQVVGRSSDGFTAGFPLTAASDRAALVAVGMNGAPLPTRHGFPARLVVPGLYGYVSATKWLTAIELTTWAFDGYWVPRGWAKEGPIKTQSRIDVPPAGAAVPAGEVVVAGVAWAPTRGVERVEVRVDGGDWADARLSRPVSDATWVQWVAPVEVGAGDHVVQVRATDGAGATQPAATTPPAPDGAEGRHRTTFRAT